MTMSKKSRKLPRNYNPGSFVCPLTTEMMEDPVMDLCAHNFERSAITEWLNPNSTAPHECCPISRKPLTVADLVPNHTLAERIDKWKWHQEHDGLITGYETTKMSPSFSDDDSDSVESVDIETAKPIVSCKGSIRTSSDIEMAAGRIRDKRRQQQNYGPVPAEFMLLPQERRVLQVVRMRAKEHREKRRRSALCNALLGVTVAIVIILVSLTIRKVVIKAQ
jgi:hypothetical protein